MNRGSREIRFQSPDPVVDASMRPRFMNRGSILIADQLAVMQLASMRPRFMNRGSTSGGLNETGRTHSFNEAPIHESGKFIRSGSFGTEVVWLQ